LLGGRLDDAEVVQKMLQVVLEHLEQIACSIETLLDVEAMSIEEVTGGLRAVEQRKLKKKVAASSSSSTPTAPAYDSQGYLLMAAEEWLARLNLQKGDEGSSSGEKKKRRSHVAGEEAAPSRVNRGMTQS